MQFQKISWEQLAKDCIRLAHTIKDKEIDEIIIISRGGLVWGRMLSDLLDLPVSNIAIESYENLQQEKEPVITQVPTKQFSQDTVLVVDEVSDSGKTFERAVSYLKNLSIKKIYTVSPYVKSKTKFMPDFYLEIIDKWIIFPYEIRETKEAFLTLFKTEEKAMEELKKVGFAKWEMSVVPAQKNVATR